MYGLLPNRVFTEPQAGTLADSLILWELIRFPLYPVNTGDELSEVVLSLREARQFLADGETEADLKLCALVDGALTEASHQLIEHHFQNTRASCYFVEESSYTGPRV